MKSEFANFYLLSTKPWYSKTIFQNRMRWKIDLLTFSILSTKIWCSRTFLQNRISWKLNLPIIQPLAPKFGASTHLILKKTSLNWIYKFQNLLAPKLGVKLRVLGFKLISVGKLLVVSLSESNKLVASQLSLHTVVMWLIFERKWYIKNK